MSYREDFIDLAVRQLRMQPEDTLSQNFMRTAVLIRAATVIRMRGDQTAVFLDTPVHEEQDWAQWLRLPFPYLYIQPEQAFPFHDYDQGVEEGIEEARANGADPEEIERLQKIKRIGAPLIRGVLLAEGPSVEAMQIRQQSRGPWSTDLVPDLTAVPTQRVLLATFLMPIPGFELNMHTLTMAILGDGRLATTNIGAQEGTRSRMRAWVIHVINFLTSPSIKLVRREHSRELQKARAKKGKPPLAGWYEITYRKHVQEYDRAKVSPKRWEHSFRYDVRGHMRMWTRGAAAGRVTWIPKHQRGIKHTLYRPKGYRADLTETEAI